MTNDASQGTVTGGCLCGAVRFEADLPSKFCGHCHCDNCRRANGAAFVTYVGFQEEQVRVTQGEDKIAAYTSDTGATRRFCSQCGSTMFYNGGPRWEGETHVILGCVDGPIDRLPGVHVYTDFKAEWYTIHDDLPQIPRPS